MGEILIGGASEVSELLIQLIGVVITLLIAYCCFKAHEPTRPPFRASVYSFILAIVFILVFILVMFMSPLVGVEMAFCGAFACHFTLIGAVHLITNDCEKYERDAKIWINSMTLLMAITGFLTLVMDYPNTKSVLHPLVIGFVGGFLGSMLDARRTKGRREAENL